MQLDAFIYQLFVSESSPEATHKYIFRPQRKLVKALQAYNLKKKIPLNNLHNLQIPVGPDEGSPTGPCVILQRKLKKTFL